MNVVFDNEEFKKLRNEGRRILARFHNEVGENRQEEVINLAKIVVEGESIEEIKEVLEKVEVVEEEEEEAEEEEAEEEEERSGTVESG